jgi:hypothetical protein
MLYTAERCAFSASRTVSRERDVAHLFRVLRVPVVVRPERGEARGKESAFRSATCAPRKAPRGGRHFTLLALTQEGGRRIQPDGGSLFRPARHRRPMLLSLLTFQQLIQGDYRIVPLGSPTLSAPVFEELVPSPARVIRCNQLEMSSAALL